MRDSIFFNATAKLSSQSERRRHFFRNQTIKMYTIRAMKILPEVESDLSDSPGTSCRGRSGNFTLAPRNGGEQVPGLPMRAGGRNLVLAPGRLGAFASATGSPIQDGTSPQRPARRTGRPRFIKVALRLGIRGLFRSVAQVDISLVK
jgi:hypothetical protein